MRKSLVVFFTIFCSLASARTYYVSPTGVDGAYPGRGTFANPWKTWHYAFNNVTPSDTVYFRGGVYLPYSSRIGANIATTAVDGTRAKPTCFFAYPDDWAMGNYPVLDCATMMTNPENYGIMISHCHNIFFKGLHLRNVRQTTPGVANAAGWFLWSNYENDNYIPNNIRFENCVAHNIGGSGFDFEQFDTLFVINCDAFNCVDTLNSADGVNPYDPGGHGDGFAVNPRPITQGNAEYSYAYFYGCRAWRCSDQGWAVIYEGKIEWEYCWSLENGNNPFSIVYKGVTFANVAPKGSGWKLWYDPIGNYDVKNEPVVQVTIRNCIGAYNAHIGLNWCDYGHPDIPEYRCHIYNNFWYGNGYSIPRWTGHFGFNVADDITTDTVGRWDHAYYNNLSYYSPINRKDLIGGIQTQSNNLWTVDASPVTNDYFISLDTTGMRGVRTRQPDGSLPVISFGKPAEGSPLIDAGVDVFGIPYNGEAPDIGWFETSSESAVPALPAYVTSLIQNATPSRLEMTFNLTLTNIVPAASAFAVTVNGSARTVSSVSVSGTKVLLTLSSPVVYGNTVTVAYNKPSANPLQTASGGQAVSFTARSVTNIVAAAIPTIVSSVIENSTPLKIDLSYNITLANIVPASSAFTVTVNGNARTVSSVAVSGTKVLLTLSSPVVNGNTVTVTYNKPSTNPLQTASGGQAASFTARSVTNNVAAVIPTIVSSVIENSTPLKIELTYNITLANIVPASSAFTVTVNGTARTVSTVAVSGTKVLLTLSSPVVNGNTVTVAYYKPSANPLQTASGGQAASFSARSVANNVAAINRPPSVNILSPTKNTSFIAPATITIEAGASDPDGSIIKVEFYQGSVKLGELTSAPYSYTWKDVPAGTYSITAAATDKQNLRTVSSVVTVVVEKSAAKVNQLPVVNLLVTNKKKPEKHDDILFVAEASDPDGTVTKVEFFNGDVKLAEITLAPYIFTLTDVDTGYYHITAIVTDNSGAKNISQTIELRVDASFDSRSELVNIFPNPNKGQFKVNFLTDSALPEKRINVFNSMGIIIFNESITHDENPVVINLDGSKPGTYVLLVTSDNTILATKKIIINR